jgi:hypothetical protein
VDLCFFVYLLLLGFVVFFVFLGLCFCLCFVFWVCFGFCLVVVVERFSASFWFVTGGLWVCVVFFEWLMWGWLGGRGCFFGVCWVLWCFLGGWGVFGGGRGLKFAGSFAENLLSLIKIFAACAESKLVL